MDIYKNYQVSTEQYQNKYKSKHWKKYDLRSDLFKKENLINFRNNSLSDGLDYRYDLEEQKKIFNNLIEGVGEKYIYENLNSENIGNSKYCFKYKDKYVDAGQNFHIKWLYEIEKLILPKKKINKVCEIGGGYGSFAQKIIKKLKCKYVSIDLPEANFLSSYYLKEHFKDLNFVGNCEILNNTLDKKTFEANDIFILNPWDQISDIKFDLIINTRSMMEMDTEIIKQYFKFIEKFIEDGGYFFNINRYRKKSVGYPIHFYEYPYDSYWKVISSKRSWRQNWVHQLITQRIKKINDNSTGIKNELLTIKKITYYFILKEKMIEFKSSLLRLIKIVIKKFLFIK